ncbi:MAG TPA: hypothetical protein VMU67_11235 [Steroidobacteraceae bacterium]|nr:hypothetical protein [Steroidobacteraceae bacterium]
MNRRHLLSAALLGALCVGAALSASADDSSDRAYPAAFPKGHYGALNGLPDWGGVWFLNLPAQGARPIRPSPKGKYLKEYQAWQHEVQTHHGEVPHHGSYCTPPGMPGIMGVFQYPIEFLFTPGRVTVHHEAWMQWRNIWTDGRKHPDAEDLDPTFYGDSIGHWEGGTLVVDTIGVKTATALSMGMEHSDKMHIVERIHLAPNDPNTLLDEMTVEDPIALEKPWHTTYSYRRSRDMNLLEFICAENDRNPVDAAGDTEFK